MFRSRSLAAIRLPKKPFFKRPYSSEYQPLPRVRLLEPAIWSVAACSTIYLGCAAYEVYQDARRVGVRGASSGEKFDTLEELEWLGRKGRLSSTWDRMASTTRGRSEQPEFTEPQKVTLGYIGLNAGVFLAASAVPAVRRSFVHIPTAPTNVTLLTSVFGHAGLMHLAANMYGMWWLMPSVARSPTFKQSSAHLSAFYLSAGILSSLAQHATAAWPRPNFAASLGASGALFALFGVMGISYPHAQVGILFIPGSIPITQMMTFVAIFDAVGIFVRYPFLRLGHAAHLGGLAVGVAYARYGGDEKIWRPARKVAFKAMRSIGII